MRILHTSDWHLGATLHGRKRHDESGMFLSWLIDTINREKIDLLLICGDVFDSSAPGSVIQRMYYEFLGCITRTCCRWVIIIAGNHDSPSLLSAPKEILQFLNIHVIGSISGNPEEEVLSVMDENGTCSLIVCAVPFLREKDIRPGTTAESGESPAIQLTRGIISHYARVADIAMERRDATYPHTPILATGHLFATGCETRAGDGIRECYVGNSVLIGADVFPSGLSYVALGHLHVCQTVAGREEIRYSGSPIPMGFSEADQEKKVIIVDIAGSERPRIEERIIPRFVRLASLKGKKHDIEEMIFSLRHDGIKTWIEVTVESIEPPSSLQNWLSDLTRYPGIECLKISNTLSACSCLTQQIDGETLEHISEREVFRRRLTEEELTDGEREDLTRAFEEILVQYQQKDRMETD
ncbi:MAG: exonuclease SbcCD subunit D C-terminal domain-containing protein [Methanospirillum sp.]|nr:exonuclease SbcCD subunit D C-terminal domain-containing protein [Methanospirillum sp.]